MHTNFELSPESKLHTRIGIYSVFKAFARLFLLFGYGYKEINSIMRKALVDAATEHLKATEQKPSRMRVGLLAQIPRDNVAQIMDSPVTEMSNRPPLQALILGQWAGNDRWRDDEGKPKRLQVTGPGSFTQLCREHTNNYSINTLLQEFLDSEKVRKLSDGSLELIDSKFAPADVLERLMLGLLATKRLLNNVHHTVVTENPKQRFFQVSAASDEIPRSRMKSLRQKARELGSTFVTEMLALLDRNEIEDGIEKDSAGMLFAWFEETLEEKKS